MLNTENPFEILKNDLNSLVNTSTSNFTLEEAQNCLKDIETIKKKIKNGYYKSADFVPSNEFYHKSKTSELYTYFSGYYERSKRWLEIFHSLPKNSIKTVLDLCPGWSPKVEFALRDWGFSGKLYVLDSNQEALKDLKNFLDIIHVDYTVDMMCNSLLTCPQMRVDLLAANHVLDDMILESYCSQKGYNLDEIYESEKLFKTVTTDILSQNGKTFSAFIKTLARKIDSLMNQKGYVIFLHYPGKLEKGLGLYEWIQFIYHITVELQQQLINKGYASIQEGSIVSETLDDSSQSLFILQKP